MDIKKIELLIDKVYQAIKIIQKLKENEKKYFTEIENLKNEIKIEKDNNIKLQEEISNLNKQIELLKEEKEKLLEEILKNENSNKELEQKIVELLKYLPDEESIDNREIDISEIDIKDKDLYKEETKEKKENIEKEKIVSEELINESSDIENKTTIQNKEISIPDSSIISEEELLKKFISSGSDSISKNLFGEKKNNESIIDNKKDNRKIENNIEDLTIFDTNIYSEEATNKNEVTIDKNREEKDIDSLLEDTEKDRISFGENEFLDNDLEKDLKEEEHQEDLPKGVL